MDITSVRGLTLLLQIPNSGLSALIEADGALGVTKRIQSYIQ